MLGKLLSTHPSKPNNPDVANVFFRTGMIEAWGRGIDKIIKMCLSDGLQEPVFDIGFGGLQIDFTAKVDGVEKSIEESIVKSIEESIVKSPEKTTEKMLILMRSNQEITIEQLAIDLNLTPGAINKQIAKLKSNNKIKRIGPKKGGYWRIVD
jgi:ATP-dependent DNA helicase RecG